MISTLENIKQKINKKIRRWKFNKFLKDNYGWIIAFLSVISIIVSNIFKFIEYLTGRIYFYYYGLDHNLYNYSDKNFIYSLCYSLIFLIAFSFLLYCFKQIGSDIKHKRGVNKTNIFNLFIIIVSNLYLVMISCSELSFRYKVIYFIAFITIESISSHVMFKDIKYQDISKHDMKDYIVNNLKSFIFLIILLIITNSLRIYFNLSLVTQYRIYNNNKVIVYSTTDYYLTLDCDIDNNELIIYKGSQEKIDNNNIKSQLTKFNKVEIKEKMQ